MPNNSKNVKFGKPAAQGAIYCAPEGTTVPTDATSALGAAFSCLGYISEDGLKDKTTRDTDEKKAWGGDVVARPQTKYGKEYTFSCIELNDATLKAVYGDFNVTSVGGVKTIRSNSKELPNMVWVFEIALDSKTVLRKVVPIGKVAEIGEVQFKDDDPVAFEITVAAFPDANGDYEIAYLAEVAGTGSAPATSEED